MGIYNGHSLQYILLISDKFATADILKILRDNSILLNIKRNENTNERYIVLSNLTSNNERLINSNYYKNNYDNWVNDYKTYITEITENIDIELNENENILLNKILETMPEMIVSHGWYNENSILTTYGNTYLKLLEYYLVIKQESDKNYIKYIIKKICNKLNYQVCDFVRVKKNNELQIKVVNGIQSKERLNKSKWIKNKNFKDGVYRIKLDVDSTFDINLTIVENEVICELKKELYNYIENEGWYLEVNVHNGNLFSY